MALPAALKFFTHSLRDRSTVGAVWPSGSGLARAMVEPLFENRAEKLRILEVGAGVGPFTARIVERLRPGDTLDVVELNPAFCEVLRKRFADAPVPPHVHEVSITAYHAEPYDHIVSGLPLVNFPIDLVEAIYARFHDLLKPDGTFVMFQHLYFREVLSNITFGAYRRRVRELVALESQLDADIVRATTVLRNVPPAQVLVRRRPVRPPVRRLLNGPREARTTPPS